MRPVFYGAMITEGLVALVWATVGLTLREELAGLSPGLAISSACELMLGEYGSVLAMLGVVVLAITSGDTALRMGRLILADMVHVDQTRIWKRLALAAPLFIVVIIFFNTDFSVLWRYFGWANQVLACMSLWMLSLMLRQRQRPCWLALIPALFMTTVCVSYLLCAPECAIGLDVLTSTLIGGAAALLALVFFLRSKHLTYPTPVPETLR